MSLIITEIATPNIFVPKTSRNPKDVLEAILKHGPMRAVDWSDVKEANRPWGLHWIQQEKLRGIRGILYHDRVYSKLGLEFVALRGRFYSPFILDGELYNPELSQEEHNSAVRQMSGEFEIQFHPFDVVDFDKLYSQRLDILRELASSLVWRDIHTVGSLNLDFRYTLNIDHPTEGGYQHIIDRGGEGVVYHHLHAYYTVGKHWSVVKRKPTRDAEAIVLHANEEMSVDDVPQGRCGSLTCKLDNGIHFSVSGLNDKLKQKYWNEPPKRITFKYDHLSDAGVPVHASFVSERDTDE